MSDLEKRLTELEARVKELQDLNRRHHPRSWLGAEGVEVGKNVRIHPTCSIIASNGRTVSFGDNVLLRRYAEIVGPVTVGSGCSFNRDVYIRANVHIGKNCNIGAFVRLITDTHTVSGPQRRAGAVSFPGISIGDGVFIGASSTVLGGLTIGDGAVVAAGSVVTKDVQPNTMVGGVPARYIKTLKT